MQRLDRRCHVVGRPPRAIVMSALAALAAFAALSAFAVHPGLAADWPQWRGPNRDGTVRDFKPPARWPDRLTQEWKVTVGTGHSSPIVSGESIYVQARQDDEEVLWCLKAKTGRTVWRQSQPAPYTMSQAATSHGKGPKSTPVMADDTICSLTINGVVSCRDALSGALKWQRDFAGEFRNTSPLYGAAMSPLIDRGVLLVHVGGNDDGALIAFHVGTGEVVWRWNGDGPSYASPIIATFDGVRQVVTQTQKHLVGIDRQSGRLLWSLPLETPWVQNIVTPVAFEDMVIFSGLEQGAAAVRPVKLGERWSVEPVWKSDAVSLYMNSPVPVGGRLCGLSHLRKGQFFCLDARTGGTVWTSRGRDADQAATLVAGDLLFNLTDGAELMIMRAGKSSVETVARYTVADAPTWAHPVLLGNDILIKDRSTLARFSLKKPAKPAPARGGRANPREGG